MFESWKDAPKHICRGGDLRGIAYCCMPIKPCPLLIALQILGLSRDEYIRLKEEFGKKTKLGLGKETCFGSLVWCCKITKPCPFRDRALEEYNITPEEYMELKRELAEYIIKNSPLYRELKKTKSEEEVWKHIKSIKPLNFI